MKGASAAAHQAARNIEDATDGAPTPEPTPTRKSPDVWTRASALARKLARLDDAEQEELAQSPSEIRARFDKKREAAMGEAEPEVLEIVRRMRATEAAP